MTLLFDIPPVHSITNLLRAYDLMPEWVLATETGTTIYTSRAAGTVVHIRLRDNTCQVAIGGPVTASLATADGPLGAAIGPFRTPNLLDPTRPVRYVAEFPVDDAAAFQPVYSTLRHFLRAVRNSVTPAAEPHNYPARATPSALRAAYDLGFTDPSYRRQALHCGGRGPREAMIAMARRVLDVSFDPPDSVVDQLADAYWHDPDYQPGAGLS